MVKIIIFDCFLICCLLQKATMESLDPTRIKIEKKTLHVPPLEELKTGI